MNYQEAWCELKQRLEKAEYELRLLANDESREIDERNRINTKIQGLMIALEYMRELTDIIGD